MEEKKMSELADLETSYFQKLKIGSPKKSGSFIFWGGHEDTWYDDYSRGPVLDDPETTPKETKEEKESTSTHKEETSATSKSHKKHDTHHKFSPQTFNNESHEIRKLHNENVREL